ncbi:alpha/beta fold hydrolase [bacterium]|nr:alpha/beta fold hydrolase [bacterium]
MRVFILNNTPVQYNKKHINFQKNTRIKSLTPLLNPNVGLNQFISRTIDISRLRVQKLAPNLKNITKEITFNFKKSNTYALDINPNNRKKYAIVLHGLGQNVTNLQPLYQSIINKTDYAIIAPEYRGFGKNKPQKISQKSLSEDTQTAIKYLKDKGIKPSDICIIGHSLGGYLASNLALVNSQVSKLILVSSAESISNKSMDDVNISLPKFTKFLIKNFPILQGAKYKKINTAKNLEKINMPVYIIHSQNDKIVKSDVAKHLASSCKNLQSIEILKEGGHVLDPTKINKIIDSLTITN